MNTASRQHHTTVARSSHTSGKTKPVGLLRSTFCPAARLPVRHVVVWTSRGVAHVVESAKIYRQFKGNAHTVATDVSSADWVTIVPPCSPSRRLLGP